MPLRIRVTATVQVENTTTGTVSAHEVAVGDLYETGAPVVKIAEGYFGGVSENLLKHLEADFPSRTDKPEE